MEETKKPIWMIVGTIIITAIIIGGGIYYWQNKKLTDSKNDLNNQITALQNQVNDLKTSSATTTTPVATTTTPTTTASVKVTEKTYKNDTYKFAFDMSKSIKQYTISEVLPNSSDKTAVLYVEFALVTTDKGFQDANGSYMVEKIAVIPTSKYKESTDPWDYSKIGTSGDYTITKVNIGGRDNPEDLNEYFTANVKTDFANFQSF